MYTDLYDSHFTLKFIDNYIDCFREQQLGEDREPRSRAGVSAGPQHGGAPGRPLRVRGGAQLLQRPGDSALDVRHQGDNPLPGGKCDGDGLCDVGIGDGGDGDVGDGGGGVGGVDGDGIGLVGW